MTDLPEPPDTPDELTERVRRFQALAQRLEASQRYPQLERYDRTPDDNRQCDRELYSQIGDDFGWGDEWYEHEQRAVIRDALLLLTVPVCKPLRLLSEYEDEQCSTRLFRQYFRAITQYAQSLNDLPFDGQAEYDEQLRIIRNQTDVPESIRYLWGDALSTTDREAPDRFLQFEPDDLGDAASDPEYRACSDIVAMVNMVEQSLERSASPDRPIFDHVIEFIREAIQGWVQTSPFGETFERLQDGLFNPLTTGDEHGLSGHNERIMGLVGQFLISRFEQLKDDRRRFLDERSAPAFLQLKHWGLVDDDEQALRLRQYYLDSQLIRTGYFHDFILHGSLLEQTRELSGPDTEESLIGTIVTEDMVTDTVVSNTALSSTLNSAARGLGSDPEQHPGRLTRTNETNEEAIMDDDLTPPDEPGEQSLEGNDEYSEREGTILSHINDFQDYLRRVEQRGELVEPSDLIDRLDRIKGYMTDYFDSHLNEEQAIQEGDPAALAEILQKIGDEDVSPGQQLLTFLQAEAQPGEEEELLEQLDDEDLRQLEFVIAHRFGRDNPIASYRDRLEEQYQGDDS